MATYIKTLKEDNGDITYPQTSSDAVLMPTGETLETRISNYVTAENIAETDPITPTITHEMIQEGAVKSDNIDWMTLGLANYSTAETPTGGVWVDGKVIYRKVVNFGNLPNTTTKNVAHGITNISTVINIYGVANYANGVRFPLPFYTPTATGNGVSLNLTSTDIQIQTGVDRSAATAYVIIEYTKS